MSIDATGISWHPNLQTEQNLITKGVLPRFVMDSYEESREPPRLFQLDKYEIILLFEYTRVSLLELKIHAPFKIQT